MTAVAIRQGASFLIVDPPADLLADTNEWSADAAPDPGSLDGPGVWAAEDGAGRCALSAVVTYRVASGRLFSMFLEPIPDRWRRARMGDEAYLPTLGQFVTVEAIWVEHAHPETAVAVHVRGIAEWEETGRTVADG